MNVRFYFETTTMFYLLKFHLFEEETYIKQKA